MQAKSPASTPTHLPISECHPPTIENTMPVLTVGSVRLLCIRARQKLGMTQQMFADAVGSSLRTVARWEGGSTDPAPWHFHRMAALLHPSDPELASDAAIAGGTTLETLGIVAPPLPTPARDVARPPPAAVPTRVLVDAIVLAAAEAVGIPPATFDTTRAAVFAAFSRARDLGLDPGDVAAVLAPAGNKDPGKAGVKGRSRSGGA
jgi:DNA-binding XRE family transcriptional regulator